MFGAYDQADWNDVFSVVLWESGLRSAYTDYRNNHSSLGMPELPATRSVDIVGDGKYFDTSDDPIYDPYPTTGSAGFDLDAVGAINTVPEPASMLLLAFSAVGLYVVQRRRKRSR